MNTPPTRPALDPPLLEEVEGAAQRALGLMRLLAVAYNSKDDTNGPPSREEADGIIWLATHTGEDLSRSLGKALECRLVRPGNHTGKVGQS